MWEETSPHFALFSHVQCTWWHIVMKWTNLCNFILMEIPTSLVPPSSEFQPYIPLLSTAGNDHPTWPCDSNTLLAIWLISYPIQPSKMPYFLFHPNSFEDCLCKGKKIPHERGHSGKLLCSMLFWLHQYHPCLDAEANKISLLNRPWISVLAHS